MDIFNIIWDFRYYILCIMFYKISNNVIYLYQTKKLVKEYFRWLNDNSNYDEIAQHKHLFKQLVKNANISNTYLPTTQPMGYNRLASFKASITENFPSNLTNFAAATNDIFYEMEGVFKSRILETFNPLYWLNLVIYLPKNLVEYFGLSSDNIGSKVLQLIWWLIGIIVTVLIELYPEYLRQLISSYLPILP